MRIAIDLRPLQIGHEYRGIGAYLINILERFPFDTSEHTFIFVRYQDSDPVKDFALPISDYEEVILKKELEGRGSKRLLQILGRRFRPKFPGLLRHRPHVYFQPDFLLGLPRFPMKKYVTMYDLIPLVLPEMYLPSWRPLLTKPGLGKRRRLHIVFSAWLRNRHYRRRLRTVRRADHVFSISEATAADLHRLLKIPKKKIETIPLAPSVPEIKTTDKQRPKSLKGMTNPFLLFIGGIDGRRRLVDLIQAFNVLNGRGYKIDLVLGGKELAKTTKIPNAGAQSAIMNSSYQDQIHLLGFMSQDEKAWLLQHALAFVYPTIYEGFGLPVLEAMTGGSPTITYNNSSLPEIAGEAAILLDEKEGGMAIYNKIVELLEDDKARQHLIDAGQKQASKFSWDRCAHDTYKSITG